MTSLLLAVVPWRDAVWGVAAIGFAVAAAIWSLMPVVSRVGEIKTKFSATGRGGFPLLVLIGVLDSAVRTGLLTCLPFLLEGKGCFAAPHRGTLALALVFVGGAGGKFACGWLGARVGMSWTVVATEVGTLCTAAVLVSPLAVCLARFPLLGIMLNGTSSVLYGTVPELTSPEHTERAFALFYTATIGSGAAAPIAYGVLGDELGIVFATSATALTALAICPLTFVLAPRLAPCLAPRR